MPPERRFTDAERKERAKASHKRHEQTPGFKKKRKQYNDERKYARMAAMNDLKRVPCQDCKVRFPPICMDFDHVRGEKIGNVAEMVNQNRKWSVIEKEVAKCEVVCACCHRLRTVDRLDLEPLNLLNLTSVDDPASLLPVSQTATTEKKCS